MHKIEYSIAAIMSLGVMSSSGSEIAEEIEESGEEENAPESIMAISDDEFEKLSPEDFGEELGDKSDEHQDTDREDEEEESLGDAAEEDPDSEATEDETEPAAEGDDSEQAEDDGESEGEQPETDNEDIETYKQVYQELFGQPIKASGREVKLRDAVQARNLIEMGVDYNKKMQYMKPHMQTLKTLEKEGLLGDIEQLNLLLEAKQGKPEAIKKLLAQAEIDVLDIADDEIPGSEYRPGNHLVSEKEVEISEALSAIKESPKYNETIDVMTNRLDPKSREVLSDNPQFITALNKDIETGVYDEIMEMVQYKKDTRQAPIGASDIELYIQTVQELAMQEQQAQQQGTVPVENTQQVSQQPKRQSSGASRKRKQAMSSTRSAKPKKKEEFDPMKALSMSDEEFMKRFGDPLL